MTNMTEEKLEQELERINKIMHFPTQKIGEYLGIKDRITFFG